MDQRVRDRVANWSERPVEGLDGVGSLADQGFSGVVESAAGTAWFAMLNGSILGVHGGRIEDFEGADAVARSAPDPGVALLMAMLAADADPEERYYTEDTPVSQAHQTLGSGGFAGYLELSENVLSGDYYVAYYGEHSAPVAFVGNSDRLITGDEALDRADDEVGIYQVYAVDLEVVDLPGRDGDSSAGTAASTTTDTDVYDPSGDDPSTGEDGTRRIEAPDSADSVEDAPTDVGSTRTVGTTSRDADPGTGTQPTHAGEAGRDPGDDSDPDRSGRDRDTEYGSSTSYGTRPGGRTGSTDPEREFYSDLDPEDDDRTGPDDTADHGGATGADPDRATGTDTGGVTDTGTGTAPADGPTGDTVHGGDTDTAETRADRATDAGADPTGAPSDAAPAGGDTPPANGATPDERGDGRGTAPAGGRDAPAGSARDAGDGPGAAGGGGGVPADLRDRIEEHQRRLEELRERAADLEAADERAREAHEGLRAEVEDIAADLGDLRRTVVRLDRTVERLESGGGTREDAAGEATTASETDGDDDGDGTTPDAEQSDASASGGRDMSPETALAETTLLLRYGSRGAPTLSAAHDDTGVERGAVEENLRVDVHTPFDDRAATVDGQPFREFIEGRIEYRFFEWLVRDLLFEIRETGTQDALRDLYDALPSIDRAELRSTVVVESEDGEEEVVFDVVVRDAHERPLVVARINASRDPATEEMVVGLRDSASRVGEDADLAAAFSVTESYFSGSARDAAEEATADSILSRNSKESYVKLSRKRGYHLCLVAVGSDEEFHLRVPDL